MIRASFVMTIFCDMVYHDRKSGTKWRHGKFTYYGKDREDCDGKAYKDGWNIYALTAACPDCAKKIKEIRA